MAEVSGQESHAAKRQEFRNYPVWNNGKVEWLTKAERDALDKCESCHGEGMVDDYTCEECHGSGAPGRAVA